MYKRELIVTKENHQLRIDDFAYQHHISRKALKVIKQCGDILVNGEHQTCLLYTSCESIACMSWE